MSYLLPPSDVVAAFDAPPTPAAVLSPDRSRLLLVAYNAYPSIALLARPFLRLGGVRVDPELGALQRTVEMTGISIVDVADGAERPVVLPEGARVGQPVWAADGTRFAFSVDVADGVELWGGDAASGAARPPPGVRVSDVLGGAAGWATGAGPLVMDIPAPPFSWTRDSRHLLVRLVPPGWGPAPARSRVPLGPRIEETAGKHSQVATFQDLLAGEEDERLFEH